MRLWQTFNQLLGLTNFSYGTFYINKTIIEQDEMVYQMGQLKC